VSFLISETFSEVPFRRFDHRRCYQWQKYRSISYFSNLSNLKTGRGTTKKHSIKSTDRANIYRIHFELFCCISFRSEGMEI